MILQNVMKYITVGSLATLALLAMKKVDLEKAKDSLNLHPTNFPLPFSNFKLYINRFIVN